MCRLLLGWPPIMLRGNTTPGSTLERTRKAVNGRTWYHIRSRPTICTLCRVHWRRKGYSAHGERTIIVTMDTCITGLARFISAVVLMMMYLDCIAGIGKGRQEWNTTVRRVTHSPISDTDVDQASVMCMPAQQ